MPTLNEWGGQGSEVQISKKGGAVSGKEAGARTMMLRDAPEGCRARVLSVHTSPAFRSELHSLGFIPGVPVRVISRNGGTSLIIEILRSRLSMSREAASAVSVQLQ